MYNFNSIGSCLTRVGLGVSLPRVASLPHARKQTSTCTYNSFRIPFTDLHLRSPQSQQTVVLHYSSPNSPSNPSASTHRTLWDLGNKTGSINTRTSSILPHLSLSLYRTFSTTSHSCYAREALQMSDLDESDFGDSLGEDSDLFVEEPKKAASKKAAAPKKAQATKKAVASKAATASKSKKRAAGDDDSAASPSSKKQRKASVKKAAPTVAKKANLSDIENNDVMDIDKDEELAVDAVSQVNGATAPKKASDQYQKLTQLEHILKRPDTYIGSVEMTEKPMWVFNSETNSMVYKTVHMVPGLYKIFDEILVNAADNKIRDPKMDTLKVTVDRESNTISVYNNGRGIPIEMHEKERIYVPEMIFGHLLTSSNYDDDEKKVTGGRNGYGAKLCNIFSTEFTLETADKSTKKKYVQTWTNNMSQMGKAKITANAKDEYTRITFKPDLAKFGMKSWDDDLEAIIKRRVYDMAGSIKDIKVFLNGERIKCKNFKQYVDMYLDAIHKENGTETKPTLIHEVINDRWEVAFAPSGGAFQQVSFVNSIATTSGGTHIVNISDQLSTKLMEFIKTKNKGGAQVKPYHLKAQFFLFVNCLIENPAFTSQTKEQLTTKSSSFGSKCALSDEFIKKVKKSEIVSNILDSARSRADQELKKSDSGRRARISNVKLLDANKAGTRQASQCTLILTEGDSAKTLAVAGIAALQDGRDLFGVFPLRGKLLNVRDATHEQITKNVEIQAIKQILGLKHQQKYESTDGLRYGHLMIMTDQDHDGSHIKGLIINFFETQFPTLLRIPGFLIEFITPIVKVFKGPAKKPTKQQSFFTMPEYESWKQGNAEKGWQHKYYKGLGTSNEQDAKVYFSDLDKHLKKFHVMDTEGKDLVELAFSKKKADERKEWLRLFKPGTYLDHSTAEITYPDFVNKELILFSIADNQRSIPSVMDGLKPGQRKCLFAAFKKNLVKDSIKVAQLAGYISEHTAYQHGEQSLQGTLVNLAQNFVGSNNINYMEPDGGFGTRLAGGADAASARYIYTQLSPFARKLFPAQDDPLLESNFDDDDKIEPVHYVPILPTILLNGSEGIGTGWSSAIPNYNPEDIVANLRKWMSGEEMGPMVPWYRGWMGQVEQTAPDKFKFHGIIEKAKPDDPNDLVFNITELPVKVWTQDYKQFLEDVIKGEKYGPSWIKDYLEYHTLRNVNFQVTMESRTAMDKCIAEGLLEKFRLTKPCSTTNLVAFDSQGRINKYASIQDMMKEHAIIRLQFYQKRKDYMISELNYSWRKLTNQARFIDMIIKKELVVSNKKRDILMAELQKLNFERFSKKKDAIAAGEDAAVVDEEDEGGYNYLLGMAIWSLTKEKVEKLLAEVAKIEGEVERLTKLTPKDMWNIDLDAFLEEWHKALEEDRKLAEDNGPPAKRPKKLTMTKGKKKNDGVEEKDWAPKAVKVKKPGVGKSGTVPSKNGDEKSEPKTITSFFQKPAREAAKKKPVVVDESSDGGDAFDVISESSVDKKRIVSKPRQTGTTGKEAEFNAELGKAATAVSKVAPVRKSVVDDAFCLSDDKEDITSPPPKPRPSKPNPSRPTARSRGKRTVHDSGDDDNFDLGSMVKEFKVSETKKVIRSKPASLKASAMDRSLLDDNSEDDDLEMLSDSGNKKTILPLSPKKPKGAVAAKSAAPPTKTSRPMRGAARTAVKKYVDSDEEEEEESEDEYEDDR